MSPIASRLAGRDSARNRGARLDNGGASATSFGRAKAEGLKRTVSANRLPTTVTATTDRRKALEGARYGVRVNVVAPGFTETNMLKEVSDHVKEKILETIPLGRFGKPEEIAWAVAYLLSPVAGGYITGTTLSVNGGRHT